MAYFVDPNLEVAVEHLTEQYLAAKDSGNLSALDDASSALCLEFKRQYKRKEFGGEHYFEVLTLLHGAMRLAPNSVMGANNRDRIADILHHNPQALEYLGEEFGAYAPKESPVAAPITF